MTRTSNCHHSVIILMSKINKLTTSSYCMELKHSTDPGTGFHILLIDNGSIHLVFMLINIQKSYTMAMPLHLHSERPN